MVEKRLTAPHPEIGDPVAIEHHFQVLLSALEFVLLDLLPPPFERLNF
jgi:hypothetical protein